MPLIRLETFIGAPPERCFEVARDVDVHQGSMAQSRESAVAGVTSGKLGPGDTVTWQATHFGLRLRLTSRITEFQPPHRFVDEMIRGPFARLRHAHEFHPQAGGTRMVDIFDYATPLGPLGWLADQLVIRRYMERLLTTRNVFLKAAAEHQGTTS